ncbi:hypothetical protein [Streptomyces sp. ICBB 8177]|uniref:hypothetical protein n=1 Tax=Streptomyces sp. ICBB 8177 TaxID=563922 RepID=UPI000D680821|nr:hypothetical protein [Streptomyces sp. ICBB 8177]PWI45834.1 hypothetical protein CK485_01325 [Streptomyces sp. ICBB 8177]
MNQAARRIGKTLALVLPVVLVLSGTLAVTRVPWAVSPSQAQVLTASTKRGTEPSNAPQDVLRRQLLSDLQRKNPGAALTDLQVQMAKRPTLARYCSAIARALGRAAVAKYGRQRAQSWSRPVCDTSFAVGVSSGANGTDGTDYGTGYGADSASAG